MVDEPAYVDEDEDVRGVDYKARNAINPAPLSGIQRGSTCGSSLYAWSRRILKEVLSSRTSFSYYVLRCILSLRGAREGPTATALFPIPLPVMDVWSGPTGLGAMRRERIAYKRVLHLVIMALNFVHAECPLKSITFLRRRPGAVHRLVYDRILALIKAGGPDQSLDLVGSGRKSFQLDARHRELLEALQSLGLSEASKYHSASSGQEVPVVNDVDELIPYSTLDASRVALTGTGSWDCTPYLSDLLYLPFVEPRINMFDVVPPQGSYPDVRGCDGEEEMKLCLGWDAKRLLRIFPAELGPQQLFRYTRVFGNFKNGKVDRQSGDRRGQNFCEGRLSGPSRSLPVMTTLLQLCPVRFEEVLVGSVTDRKDFYHQFAISDEKASLNAIYLCFACPTSRLLLLLRSSRKSSPSRRGRETVLLLEIAWLPFFHLGW